MNTHKDIFSICGFLMLATEVWKQWCLTYRLGGGQYNWWYFPFQLCSIPMYICLLLFFVSSVKIRRILLTFLMDFGLLAGVFTFFDTSGLNYSYFPLTVHSYVWHVVLILLGLYAGYRNRTEAKYKDFAGATGIYFFCCLAATVCNLAFYSYGKINMFYISPHFRMTQKVFRHIALILGNDAGIMIYIFSIVLGAFILHMLWIRAGKQMLR